LQQQREHKDEYNFISELMMLRTLVEDAGLSPAQIAAQQERGRGGEQKVKNLLAILDLMDIARRLLDPPVPISALVNDTSQEENWLGILRRYRELRKSADPSDADDLLRGFMVTTYLKLGAVHKGGRSIDENWVEGDLVTDLKSRDDEITKALVEHIEHVASQPALEAVVPEGADLLGDVSLAGTSPVGTAVLGIVHQAASHGNGELTLATGQKVDATEALHALTTSAQQAITDSKRRADAGNRLERPVGFLEGALKDLRDARAALIEVTDSTEFESRRENAATLVEEIQVVLEDISGLLENGDSD
jgi:hypothetical protein